MAQELFRTGPPRAQSLKRVAEAEEQRDQVRMQLGEQTAALRKAQALLRDVWMGLDERGVGGTTFGLLGIWGIGRQRAFRWVWPRRESCAQNDLHQL